MQRAAEAKKRKAAEAKESKAKAAAERAEVAEAARVVRDEERRKQREEDRENNVSGWDNFTYKSTLYSRIAYRKMQVQLLLYRINALKKKMGEEVYEVRERVRRACVAHPSVVFPNFSHAKRPYD